jgi:membrane protease YdiL (CAAX protease family)
MTTIKALIKRYPLLSYVALSFAISWGGVLIVAGPGELLGTKEMSEALFPIVVLATLAGPSVAGILLTGLVYGKAGLRELLSRLLRWRVGVRWYAVALLTAPLTMLAGLLALSLVSPAFRPLLFVVDDQMGLLVFSVVAGLIIGIFEELGWMGFAVPTLLGRRYGVLGTGLIIGLLWGVGHFSTYLGSSAPSGALPLALLLPVLLFSWQPAYRVLMVWVYERTGGSLPVAMLMSASFVVAYNILRNPMTLTLTNVAAFYLGLTVVWYAIVAVVALANHGHLTRWPRLRRRVA